MLKKNQILIFLFFCSVNMHSQTTSKSRFSTFTIEVPQLQTNRKIWLYLPLDYEKSDKKYPVIYMHDGQNLFDAKTSFAGEWNIDETLDSIKAKVIVVGIENGGEKRIDELTPFKNSKYGGGNANNYLEFIVKTLKPYIDSNYKTKINAKNTCLFGSSLGGFVSFYGALKYPEVFGKVGCFSPSFWFNRDEIFDLMNKNENYKTKIYFLCGDNEGDDDMIKDLNKMEYAINTKRCECRKLNQKIIVKGGQHNEKLWREGFKKAYLWLF
jgi:predicted alpha/beta superfamily hydrolase